MVTGAPRGDAWPPPPKPPKLCPVAGPVPAYAGTGVAAPLPPGKDQSSYDHYQDNLEQQADYRGKARHAAKKSLPEQQARQTGTKEASGKTAKQSSAKQSSSEQTGTRRLTHGRGVTWLCHGTLDRRSGRCSRRRSRRRECTPASAATREAAAGARMRVSPDEDQRDGRDDDCDEASMTKHDS